MPTPTPAGDRLRERAWGTLARATSPLTAPQLAQATDLTNGAALTFLTEWAATGRLVRRPDLTSTASFADTYATPALLAHLDRSPTMPTPPPAAEPTTSAPAPYRVLITGSRTWYHDREIHRVLDGLHAKHPGRLVIVHGGCTSGADFLADQWAHKHHVPVEVHPADWTRDRKRAGMLRNTEMVQAGADLYLAFIRNDSPGATHCANAAEKAGIPGQRYTQHESTDAHWIERRDRAQPVPRHARGAIGTVRRDRLVTAALAYAERGWHVFPLRPDDKRPAFPNHPETACNRTDPRCARARRHVSWQERATTDPVRIRTAWTAAPYGIGIACGPSGLVVLDLDTPKPGPDGKIPEPPPAGRQPGVHDGADVLTLLCERAGQPLPLGTTYTVHTARKGLHLYFTHPTGPELRNTSGDLGWLIDTRAHGGYVVAPPSTAAGLPYTAEDDTAAAAPLPEWLTKTLTPAALPDQEPVSVRLSGIGDERRRRYLQAAVDRCVDAVRTSGDGQHNRALYGAAVQLGQLVAGRELAAGDVIGALLPAGIAVGQPEAQARKTIASGLKAGANRPRTIDSQGAAA